MLRRRRLLLAVLAASSLACSDEPPADTISTGPGPRERDASAQPPDDAPAPPAAAPIVFLIADTSGSMERLPGCECTTPACLECLPDCAAGQRSRFILLLEALTGSFERTGCTALTRSTANGASYDVGYYLPYNRPHFADGQRRDGVIDRYGDRIRFGLGTFDGVDTYASGAPLVEVAEFDASASAGMHGLWSFGTFEGGELRSRPDGSMVGHVGYPGTDRYYLIDKGLRGETALDGALVFPGGDRGLNGQVQIQLLAARPYGSTPIAAAFDDLDFYLRSLDPQPAAPVYVVLVTDGLPDSDYRDLGCDCALNPEGDFCPDPSELGDDVLGCPYPPASEAARTLRCGHGSVCEDGVVEQVFVVDLDLADPGAPQVLDPIAEEGGTGEARSAAGDTLGDVVASIMDEILAR